MTISKEKYNSYMRGYHRKRREAIILACSDRCACCDEKEIKFLTIMKLDGYKFVMCKNCEWAVKFYGDCPHLARNGGKLKGRKINKLI